VYGCVVRLVSGVVIMVIIGWLSVNGLVVSYQSILRISQYYVSVNMLVVRYQSILRISQYVSC
jgi:hypothetical protein